jgi:general secretion pathway protein N
MRLRNTTHWRAITLVSLLACAFTISGSTAAVPTDAGDLDAAPPRRLDTPATPSLWDRPAASAPVVVTAPAPARRTEPEHAKSANPLWAIPLATLATTRDRPIFSPSRRPPPPAVAPAPVAAAPPPRPKPAKVERPQLALVGTIAGPEQSFGIFVDQATKTALRLKLGEDYQGWRLRAVASREVTLEHDDQTAVLSLPPPEANAAQPVTTQAENVGPMSEFRRERGARR